MKVCCPSTGSKDHAIQTLSTPLPPPVGLVQLNKPNGRLTVGTNTHVCRPVHFHPDTPPLPSKQSTEVMQIVSDVWDLDVGLLHCICICFATFENSNLLLNWVLIKKSRVEAHSCRSFDGLLIALHRLINTYRGKGLQRGHILIEMQAFISIVVVYPSEWILVDMIIVLLTDHVDDLGNKFKKRLVKKYIVFCIFFTTAYNHNHVTE